MPVNFRTVDRDTPALFPPSIQDYLPEDHLARFVVEIVDQLNLSPISQAYSGKGKAPFHPSLLVALLFYGYATGTFSSRKLEKASYDSIAYRFICANSHPDHDTIAHFRQRFMKELTGLFHQILLVGQAMGLVKLGTVSLDGTKIKANASKHKALSWEYANRLEAQLEAEVEELLRLAEEADNNTPPEQMDIPAELKRREERLSRIARAKKEIEARAQARHQHDMDEYREKVDRRRRKEKETGKKAKGREPKKPDAGPKPKDQVNLTDEESRVMPSSEGFQQTYNAQAAVDIETHMIHENHVSQHPNDKQEIEPTLAKLKQLPESLGKINNLLADTGYDSEGNVNRCKAAGITPYISQGRQKHNPPLKERYAADPESPEDPTPVQAMRHRMQTKDGKALYSKRKSTVETVFGVIKQVLGFRQFHLRGLQAVESEWSLVCMAWNLKRMHVLNG